MSQSALLVPSLEAIVLERIASELGNHRSLLFGESLPGVLSACLGEDLTEKLYQLQTEGDTTDSVTPTFLSRLRPFFGTSFIHQLTLTQFNDALARELSPLHFPQLQMLAIEDSPRLSDVGLGLGLSQFKELKQIRFKRCSKITWMGLAKIPLTERLELVDSVTGSATPTEQHLFPIKPLRKSIVVHGSGHALDSTVTTVKTALGVNAIETTGLDELVIGKNPKVDDEFAFACASATNLQHVSFTFCNITHQGLSAFAFMENLKSLDLSFCSIQFQSTIDYDEHEVWNALRHLESLNLSGADFGSDPSRVLSQLIVGCRSLTILIARSSKLRNLSVESIHQMLSKLEVLDLSGNKNLGDELFLTPDGFVSSLRELHLSNTGIRQPQLPFRSNWPCLSKLVLDSNELSQNFILNLLAGGEHVSTVPGNVSLQNCKSLTNSMLLQICEAGGLRDTLSMVDLSCGHFAPREMYFLLKRLRLRNNGVVIFPELHSTTFEEGPAVVATTFGADDDASSESTVNSAVLRRFIRNVETLEGSRQDSDQSVSGHDHSSVRDDLEEAEEKSALVDSCCHCFACSFAHPGSILLPKIRYSMEDLRSIRTQMSNTHSIS